MYLEPSPEKRVDRVFITQVTDLVLSHLPGKRALELGVGHQIWTPRLIERFEHVTTVEHSQLLLDELGSRMKASNWEPVCADFEEYRPAHAFDAILATYVLEHVTDPVKQLSVMRGWLSEAGHIAIVVPNGLSLHRRLAVYMGISQQPQELSESDQQAGHFHCFRPDEMEAAVLESGYEVVHRAGMILKALPNAVLMHCTDEQLKGLFRLGLELPLEYSGALFYLIKPKN
jgi:2-polyprenyl-3-methyl-5-hydroxy-6-metoxy-1,4-benzoquinol methylase